MALGCSPKVGIAAHIDTHSAFRDGIVSVSMGGPCVMVFRKADDPAVARAVLLRPRCALRASLGGAPSNSSLAALRFS